MPLVKLQDFVDRAAARPCRKLAVAVAQDEDVLLAVKSAVLAGIVEPVLVGDREAIVAAAAQAGIDIKSYTLIHEPDKAKACLAAVRLIREHQAEILMKGLVSTGVFVKAILNKESGLMKGSLLSHIAFFETPYYHKLLCVTDAALNIQPDLQEKAGIIQNAVGALHRLGNRLPKVAVLAAVETVNPKMEATVHASMLTLMQKRNQIEGCLVDGPLALDNAVSAEAAKHKGIISEVAGDADILVTPDLNTGNVLYKSLIFLGGARTAAVVVGASVPVVLTSRADSDQSKFLSIALAAGME
jgi:phosphate butyryltransferase